MRNLMAVNRYYENWVGFSNAVRGKYLNRCAMSSSACSIALPRESLRTNAHAIA